MNKLHKETFYVMISRANRKDSLHLIGHSFNAKTVNEFGFKFYKTFDLSTVQKSTKINIYSVLPGLTELTYPLCPLSLLTRSPVETSKIPTVLSVEAV